MFSTPFWYNQLQKTTINLFFRAASSPNFTGPQGSGISLRSAICVCLVAPKAILEPWRSFTKSCMAWTRNAHGKQGKKTCWLVKILALLILVIYSYIVYMVFWVEHMIFIPYSIWLHDWSIGFTYIIYIYIYMYI